MKGKLTRKAVSAIAVTFLGSVLIALGDSAGSGIHLYGDLLAVAAAIVESYYTLIGRVVRQKTSTSVYTYMVYSACTAVLLTVCAFQGSHIVAYGLSPVVVGLLLALFSTIMGHSILSWCLKFFSPSFVSASKLCEPVAAAVMAVFLFGEMPRPMQIGGSILILGGVFAYSRIERKNESA